MCVFLSKKRHASLTILYFSYVVNLPESQFRNSKFLRFKYNKTLLRPFFQSFHTNVFLPWQFSTTVNRMILQLFFVEIEFTEQSICASEGEEWGNPPHPPTGVNYSKPRRPQKWEKCSKWADSSQRFLKLIVKSKRKRTKRIIKDKKKSIWVKDKKNVSRKKKAFQSNFRRFTQIFRRFNAKFLHFVCKSIHSPLSGIHQNSMF